MGLGQTFGFYNYVSDDGNTYNVKLSNSDAAAGGFVATSGPIGTVWPYKAKNLRYVLGLDISGNRTRLPIASNANSLYKTGGTFPLQGRTYNVLGIIGEKRKLNSVG